MADDTQTVGVWDPQRKEKVQVPRNVASNLVSTGYHYKIGDDADKEEFDQGLGGAAVATAHSYANSLTFGGLDLAATNVPSFLGGDSVRDNLKRVHHQEEIHPNYATVADVGGYFGPGGLLHLLGKGAEKVGMHALLKAAAKHTPQHLVENLGKEQAVKYGLGQTAQRLAGKAGSAVGFGVENAIRGGTKADVDQQLYSTKYDVEKVAQAIAWDGLVGMGTDAGFGLAGEGMRGLRKAVSKAGDIAERNLNFKMVKTGKVEGAPEEIRTVKQRRKRTIVEKTESRTQSGGGYTEETTALKARNKSASSEDTSSSSQATNKGSRNTDQTNKTGNAETIVEDIYKDPDAPDKKPKIETGIEWDVEAKPDDIMGSIRHQLNEKIAGDDVHKAWANKVIELEAAIKEHHTNGQFLKKFEAIKEKRELQDYFRKHVDGYGTLLDEYSNVSNGHYDTFNPANVEKPLKVGKKTTKESFAQSTRTKENQSSVDKTAESKRSKTSQSSETTEESKTKSRINEDKNDTRKSTTTNTIEYEPFESVRHKRTFNPTYKKEYQSPIPWQLAKPAGYAAGIASVHLPVIGGAIAPALAVNAAIPHVLNNRSTYSRLLDKATQGPTKALGTLTRNLVTSKINSDYSAQGELSRILRDPDKHYAAITKRLNEVAANPEAAQQAVQGRWQHVMTEHPHLQTGLIVHAQNVSQVLQAHIPKDQRPPTPQHTPYNPPRSQKIKFLRLYHAINKPLAALENPTPAMVDVIEKTSPETLNLVRRSIIGHIAENGKPFTGKAAQVISTILGQPVNTRNDTAYLKRMQAVASMDVPATQPSGGNMQGPHAGSIAGPKSAKVQQDAAMLYATPQQLHEIA